MYCISGALDDITTTQEVLPRISEVKASEIKENPEVKASSVLYMHICSDPSSRFKY